MESGRLDVRRHLKSIARGGSGVLDFLFAWIEGLQVSASSPGLFRIWTPNRIIWDSSR